jgi:ribosomal protein L7Ae-like RNA K-turn-binding protein
MSGLLGLLGLGLRGRLVVLGVDAVRAELKRGAVRCVVLAADASPRAVEKVGRLAEGAGVPLVRGPSAAEIGARLGRPPVMVVGVRDRGMADGILRASPGREVMED